MPSIGRAADDEQRVRENASLDVDARAEARVAMSKRRKKRWGTERSLYAGASGRRRQRQSRPAARVEKELAAA